PSRDCIMPKISLPMSSPIRMCEVVSVASKVYARDFGDQHDARLERDLQCRTRQGARDYGWITSCRSNIPMNCSIFFARVSARFAVWIRNRMAYQFALFRVAKNAFAFGCA